MAAIVTFPPLSGGPDAARYIAVAQGVRVPRPFNLRHLWPTVCGTSAARWWVVCWLSWPITAAGFVLWQSDHGWPVAVGGAVLLLALPGILGPAAVIPVGVDMPTLALAMIGCWVFTLNPGAGCLVFVVAAAGKETIPVWVSLWLWNPLPLIALVTPAAGMVLFRPGPDPLGAKFDHIAKHPIRTALDAHRGRWRDGWLIVAPWGVTLIALCRPSVQLVVVLLLAYAQLLVATDTVRLYQHAAGPVMAISAAQLIPPEWLLLACVVHVVWWRIPERI